MKKLFDRSKTGRDEVSARRRRADTTVVPSLDQSDSASGALNAYRRNRTITGSSSAHVASSNELNAELRSPRAHTHHLTRTRRRVFMHFAWVVVAGVALYMVIGQLIATVVVTPNNASATVLEERKREYASAIMGYLDKHPLERALYSINTVQLQAYMAEKYPEIAAIQFDSTGVLGRVNAYITLRQPILRWSLRGRNDFVDQQGVVFAYNAFAVPSLQIIDSSGAASASGIVTSNRFLAFVGRVVGAAKAQGYTVTEAIIPALTTRQLEIKVNGTSYTIKYTLDRPAGEQAEDMARMIRYLQQQGITPTYIDVRTEGRAVYR